MTIGAKNFGEDRTRGFRNMRAEIMWIGLNLALKIGCHGNVPVSDRKTNFRSFTVRPTLKICVNDRFGRCSDRRTHRHAHRTALAGARGVLMEMTSASWRWCLLAMCRRLGCSVCSRADDDVADVGRGRRCHCSHRRRRLSLHTTSARSTTY